MEQSVVYVGMEQVITLAVVLGVGFALLVFLAKTQFNDIKSSIKENNAAAKDRMDKIEQKTNEEIDGLKKEMSNIKGDFATSFVLREDFFRAMNGVEDNMKETGKKVDKILLLVGEKNNRG